MDMVRTQVQLPEGDLRELQRMAKEEHVSVSELVRRGVRCVIEQQGKPSRRELMERALEVAGKYDSGLTDVAERHDDYLAEAYDE
jgi:Arc/MetJ-type ribon-helix-helix transcriptional regulator